MLAAADCTTRCGWLRLTLTLLCSAACRFTLPTQFPPVPLLCLRPLQVLSRANHQAGDMLRTVGGATAAAVAAGDMPADVADRLMATYRARMQGYTYMV